MSEKNEAVISASKFLDLLSCVYPAVSQNEEQKYICCVELELIAKEYAIRAVATNGQILSVAQRELGFSKDTQTDIEDFITKEKVKDAKWLISSIDIDLLITSLKKLGVRRNKEDEEGRYYIAIKEIGEEGKQRLNISILGLSHVVLEPYLVREEFPKWKTLVPKESYANIESIAFDLKNFHSLNKCWGNEKIFMSFFNNGTITKINRNTQDEETIKDFIVFMPINKDSDNLDEVNKNQMNLI